MDSLTLRQRVQDLRLKAARLDGVRKAGLEQNEQLTDDVAKAKGRMSLGEEVTRVFEAMQQRAHERSVGTLESLLSAVLHDVMPEEGKVRLIPQYKANTTHLDVSLEKNGGLEDIYDGNGGAVNNVVCAGLRFAALARTKNRRIMILDEPDCWLKPTKVPAFVATIGEVSVKAGVQTLYISHYDASFFQTNYNIVHLGVDERGKVYAEARKRIWDWENDTVPGIRAIELFNFRTHEHTFLPCMPGPTVYEGDNNLGKSHAVAGSFKAVAYGDSDDSVIKRGCDEARIVIHLESNRRVEWSRHVKRSPTVMYTLWEGDEKLAEGRPKSRGDVPEWVTQALGISKVDELDIQVGNQKSPVFLLNDSAPRRAQILSVGREASYLKDLMKGYEEVKTRDREVIKQGELQLIKLKLRLGYLARLEPELPRLEVLQKDCDAMAKVLEGRERLESVLSRLEAATTSVAQLEAETGVLSLLPEVPQLVDFKPLDDLIKVIERNAKVESIGDAPQIPAVPELKDLAELRRLGSLIASLEKVVNGCPEVPQSIPALPEMQDTTELAKLIERLTGCTQSVESAEKLFANEDKAFVEAQAEEKRLKEEAGECPLCGHAFEKEEAHVH